MGEVHVIPFGRVTARPEPSARRRKPVTPDRRLVVHGVALSSRYDLPHEYDEMAAIIDALPPELRCLIESVFCDSKASASFDVSLRQTVPPGLAQRVGAAFEQACFVVMGGHNGISVSPSHVLIDADWPELP
jgi:hypothetical protein